MNVKNKLINSKYRMCLIIFLLLSNISFSCKKFLDERADSKQVKFSADDCQALLDDYSTMNTGYPSDGEVSSDNYYLTSTSWAAIPNLEDRNLHIWNTKVPRLSSAPQWLNPYKVVYNANLVIAQLGKSKGDLDQNTVDRLNGSALFFRAYAHFQIAQLYAKPYDPNTASQDRGIPIRLSPDLEANSERGTVKHTYDQIIQDLNNAIILLPVSSEMKTRPNKVATYAALARVYLAMGDYVNAGANATACLNLYSSLMDYNSSDISKTSNIPFTRFNTEVIFQSIVASSIIQSSMAKIPQDLLDSYELNDLRKNIFFKQNTGTNTGTYRFTGNYEPTTTSTFFNGLATDEIVLIRAESFARTGKISEALADLNYLLRNRYSGFTDLTIVNPEDLLKRILSERRKELIFRNLRWSDLRRLNKEDNFKITLSRTLDGTTYTLPPNDDLRYVLLIPQEVISTTNFQQNAR